MQQRPEGYQYPLYYGMYYPIVWCSRCSIFPIDIHRWDGSPPLLNVVEGNMAGTPLDPATIGGEHGLNVMVWWHVGLKIGRPIAPFTEKSSANSGLSIVVHNTSPELASGLSHQFVGQVLGGSYYLVSSERPWFVSPLSTFILYKLYIPVYPSYNPPIMVHFLYLYPHLYGWLQPQY